MIAARACALPHEKSHLFIPCVQYRSCELPAGSSINNVPGELWVVEFVRVADVLEDGS